MSGTAGTLAMEAGRIRAAGSHQELLATDELYARLVEALRIGTPTAELDQR